MPSPSSLSLLFLSVLFLCGSTTIIAATPSTGSISIFSDAGCEHPVFGNNYTLAADICGSPSTNGHVDSFNGAYNSYILDGRPTCANGTKATYTTYQDAKCQTIRQQFAAGETFSGGFGVDGICIGMASYLSLAFLCEGLPPGPVTTSINTLPTIAPVLSSLPITVVQSASTTETAISNGTKLAPTPPAVGASATATSASASPSSESLANSTATATSINPGGIGLNLTSPTTRNGTLLPSATITPSVGATSDGIAAFGATMSGISSTLTLLVLAGIAMLI